MATTARCCLRHVETVWSQRTLGTAHPRLLRSDDVAGKNLGRDTATASCSIIIPFRDAEQTLEQAVRAVADQVAGRPVEIILVDNGSSDGSRARALALGAEYDTIRLVDASHVTGPAATRNVGAEQASSSILAFTDADDVVLPGWVDALLNLRGAPDLFASGPVLRFENGQVPGPESQPGRRAQMWHMRYRPYADGSNLVVAREVFVKAAGFDTGLQTGEDVDLSWRLQRDGIVLHFVPELRVAARWRDTTCATLRQYYRYGRGDVLLFKRHRVDGAQRDPLITLARAYAGVLLRLPLLGIKATRRRWAHQAGRRVGRLMGSLRNRVFYP